MELPFLKRCGTRPHHFSSGNNFFSLSSPLLAIIIFMCHSLVFIKLLTISKELGNTGTRLGEVVSYVIQSIQFPPCSSNYIALTIKKPNHP
jgi:hypothetical protein